MRNLVCQFRGHRVARVVFSTNGLYCTRCGRGLGHSAEVKQIVLPGPPTTIKRGTPARFRRWADPDSFDQRG